MITLKHEIWNVLYSIAESDNEKFAEQRLKDIQETVKLGLIQKNENFGYYTLTTQGISAYNQAEKLKIIISHNNILNRHCRQAVG